MDLNDNNNSFNYFDKENTIWDIELERHNSSALYSYQINNLFENTQMIKKNSLDLSDSEERMMFVDKLNISEIKPIHQSNEYISIKENPQSIRGFDPILEIDEKEFENNDESFIYENNSLLKDIKDQDQSHFDNDVNFLHNETLQEDDMDYINNIRKNFLEQNSSSNCLNKTFMLPQKKKFFNVSNSQTKPLSKNSNNMSQVHNTILNNTTLLNSSFNASILDNKNNSLNHTTVTPSCKKGRKKVLLEGVKTEVLEKAFLREFKQWLKQTNNFKLIYDHFSSDEKVFWNEFINNSSPPFLFTINNRKQEFRSYSKQLIRYIFSYHSSRYLYDLFIKERDQDIVHKIFGKKSKVMFDNKLMVYYSIYGGNLHKIYSPDFEIEELEDKYQNALSIPSVKLSSSSQILSFSSKRLSNLTSTTKDHTSTYNNSNLCSQSNYSINKDKSYSFT